MNKFCLIAFAAFIGLIQPSHVFAQQEPVFGTRSPQVCPSIKTVPTVRQIEDLVRCNFEYKSGNSRIALLEEVKVEVGGTRAYNAIMDANASGIDTSAPVMPIRGSMIQYGCNNIIANSSRGHNCRVTPNPQAEGKCWKTTFGDWRCGMSDANHIDGTSNQPPHP